MANNSLKIEHFERTEEILAIQKALGISQTGKWDKSTNEEFTKWLRSAQAEHMGDHEADGWVGKKTIAGLEGKIDVNLYNAIKDLYQDGSLNKIHYKNEGHKIALNDIKSAIK
jgi:hypothetical protein